MQGNQVVLAHRAAAGLRGSGRSRRLTPGQGGEEGEVCGAGAHSRGGNVGTPRAAAPVPGTNSKTTCFLLLTPGAQPAPPPPRPLPPSPGGSGSARGMNASGSSGSRLGIGKGWEQEGWEANSGEPPRGSLLTRQTYFHHQLSGGPEMKGASRWDHTSAPSQR